MESNKSLDAVECIAALLHDVHTSHGVALNNRALKLTLQKINKRVRSEGIGFLTKTLPRLGKALDRALSGGTLSATSVGFEALPNSELPRFLGEFFQCVFHHDGTVLLDPCAESVGILRQVLFMFYKYELPYSPIDEQEVIQKFLRTEDELTAVSTRLSELSDSLEEYVADRDYRVKPRTTPSDVVRGARILLKGVFRHFDLDDILPSHGPGAVSTKERLWDKWTWRNVPERITEYYPLDEFYYSSLGHVCDSLQEIQSLTSNESYAKVVLVPKDSRGPRLISEEPLEFMWIQQGLSRAIVHHVEHLRLTRYNVFFTNQQPNTFGALLGSKSGKYATIDLNEASDRVSVDLVRLLFPPRVVERLLACRSLGTLLPNGQVLTLKKFAPMGSALCFPILALSVWAILTAAAPNRDTRESILVYGDDVIVPTAFAANAIEQLESFGLKVNRDKSCTNGFFRESCGMDAFKGHPVTPVRIRTVWSTSPSPESYASWIAYANSAFDRKYFTLYNLIVERLVRIYGPIPDDSMRVACPCLRSAPELVDRIKVKNHARFQKRQYLVTCIRPITVRKELSGWRMLLRYFTEGQRAPLEYSKRRDEAAEPLQAPFSVRLYTKRNSSLLEKRWRCEK
jgi:hypothetical protein